MVWVGASLPPAQAPFRGAGCAGPFRGARGTVRHPRHLAVRHARCLALRHPRSRGILGTFPCGILGTARAAVTADLCIACPGLSGI